MKMMKKYIIALAAVAGLTAAGCSSEMPGDDNAGKKYGTLSMQSITCVIDETEMSRATSAEDFIVEIFKGENQVGESYTYGEMPEALILEVGDGYSVKVHSAELKSSGFDVPYFKGATSKDFSIKENVVQEIEPITCTLVNIKVTVDLSGLPDNLFSDAKTVEVKYNGEVLEFNENNFEQSGYFAPAEDPNAIMTADFSSKINGEEFKLPTETYKDIKGGTHHIIAFNVKTSEGKK